jgi:subtilase family serine protease
MKATLLGIFAFATAPLLAIGHENLPVWIPESSGKVENGEAGSVAHTRLRILATETKPNATVSSTSINTPTTIRGAYELPATGGQGAIAIVDAYHYPTSLADFNTFSKTYGLPQETSTQPTASGNKAFEVIFASGRQPQSGGSYIASWNLEEALDIEWAHALAPSAKIYLVEAASSNTSDLMRAVQVAARLSGVHEVSMSWGSGESRTETSYDSYFSVSNVTFFTSGGDSTDELEWPSASPNVVSVGGTTLNRNSSGALTSETVWDETGCGISKYEMRPTFQNVISSDVGNHRGANDVAFDADPNTGVLVYDSTPLYNEAGWWTVGGTSVGSPSWAGVVNLASVENQIATGGQNEDNRIYENLGDGETFRDITSGQDGNEDGTAGWDQPTGLGSPLGLGGK